LFSLSSVFILIIGFVVISFTLVDVYVSIYALFLLILGIYTSFQSLKKLLNRDPQIIINDKGILIPSTFKFYKWSEIMNEEVTCKYLFFEHSKGIFEIEIEELNISKQRLNKLLILYRKSHNEKNN
jgi:hypothetical protein